MKNVLLAMLALFTLTAAPMVFADDQPLPEVPAADNSSDSLPPLTDSGDAK